MKRRRETITRGSNWLDFGTSYSYDDEKLTLKFQKKRFVIIRSLASKTSSSNTFVKPKENHLSVEVVFLYLDP